MLRKKSKACDEAKALFKKIQNEKRSLIKVYTSDHGKEFDNSAFEEYCDDVGIKQELSAPITPQQNRVVEKKNIVIQDMACDMIHGQGLTTHFWGEAINVA